MNLVGNIDKQKVQYGLGLMGIPKSKITEIKWNKDLNKFAEKSVG